MAIARAARDAVAVAFRERVQDDVPPGLQACVILATTCAAVNARSRPACIEAAGIHARHAGQVRPPAAAVVLRRRGRRQRDIASGAQDDLAALDRRDQIAQIPRAARLTLPP